MSKFHGRYESESSDYEEYSNDDEPEYLTESEHEISSDDEDDERKADETDDGDDDDGTVLSEPEPEIEEKVKESDESEDDLAKKFDEWRSIHKPQELPDELLEKSGEHDGDAKTETNNTTEEKDKAKPAPESDKDSAEASNEYPKELLEYLRNKKKRDRKHESSDSEVDDDSEVKNKGDITKPEDGIKNVSEEVNLTHRKKHLYTQVTMPSRNKYWISVPQAEKRDWSCTDKTKLITLRPQGRFGHREYRIIEREMERTRRGKGAKNFGYEIVKVEKIVNPCLWRRYRNRRKEILLENGGDCNEKMLFHGSLAWKFIIMSGLDERHSRVGRRPSAPPRQLDDAMLLLLELGLPELRCLPLYYLLSQGVQGNMFGAGLYFAENSSKSNRYVFGISKGNRCPVHKDKNCTICKRVLLLFRVCLGKTKEETEAVNLSFAPVGYNSITAIPMPGSLMYREYVIYRGEQAYPEYVITYKLKPL